MEWLKALPRSFRPEEGSGTQTSGCDRRTYGEHIGQHRRPTGYCHDHPTGDHRDRQDTEVPDDGLPDRTSEGDAHG